MKSTERHVKSKFKNVTRNYNQINIFLKQCFLGGVVTVIFNEIKAPIK